MPRYRKLYVKAVESLDINEMPDDFTRLLWTLLPLGLCREGRGLDNTAWVKARIFPLRNDVTPEQVGEALNWYAQRGMIRRYQVDGRAYFHVPTWHKYQGNTSKEAESNYPPPPDSVQSHSRATPEQRTPNSVTDADVDSDAHVEVDVDSSGATAPASTPPSSEAETVCKELYGPAAFSEEEIGALKEAEKEEGAARVCEVLRWAHGKSIRDMRTIVSTTATWTSFDSRPNGTGPPGHKGGGIDEFLDLAAEYRAEEGAGAHGH